MSTSTQIIIAVLTTVGVATAITLAFALAGAFFERSAARAGHASRDARLVQHVTQTDDARELVLR
jgi:hypothetical protein